MVRRFSLVTLFGIAVSIAAAVAAIAQGDNANFPDHPIRLIVSVPAGGGVDTLARIVAAKMQQQLGQPIVIENKPGVGGSIGAEAVFNAAPDGYTLLASQPSPITTNALIYKLNYDPTQFIPVAIISHVPNVLLVRADFPGKTVQDLIALAKRNPGKLLYGSQGLGTTSHVTAELFQKMTQTKLSHIPYKGTAPALNDLLAGNVDLMFNELASSIELYRSDRARILAVTVDQRVPSLPEIPTMEEAGVPNFTSDTWHAISAPPKTPGDIIAKLNAAANTAMQSPDLLDRYRHLSVSPGGGTPAEAEAFIKAETARWGEVIREAGIKQE